MRGIVVELECCEEYEFTPTNYTIIIKLMNLNNYNKVVTAIVAWTTVILYMCLGPHISTANSPAGIQK